MIWGHAHANYCKYVGERLEVPRAAGTEAWCGRGANAQASPVYPVSISIIYCVCLFCDDGLPTTFKAASVQALERVQKRRPNRYKQRAHKVP